MDAVEFIKEYRRMCEKYAYMEARGEDCSSECPLYGGYCDVSCKGLEPKYVVSKVEQWSQDHPQKTMMQDFFEKFPNAPKTILGFPYPCAKDLGYPRLDSCSFGLKNTPGAFCKECWSRPMKD